MNAEDRPALSRDRIAATALQLIDANGLGGLSMRKLGAELGVEAMSLYHYVTNKSDLLDAVTDHLYSEIELPDVDDADWESAIRLGLRSFRNVLVRHEAALELFSSRQAPSEHGIHVLYWAHQRFVKVGLTVDEAHSALHFAVSFVMGHAATELGGLTASAAPAKPPAAIDDPEMADFFAHVERITTDDVFDAGLEMVVAGLRHRYQLP